MKKICSAILPLRINELEEIYMKILLSMIESSSFNAKMNALKEVKIRFEKKISRSIFESIRFSVRYRN